MKKAIVIFIYFLLFWVILPALLIVGARYVDENLFSGMSLPGHFKVAGFIVFIPGFLFMLLSVGQFRLYGKEFPVSAAPPAIIIQKGLFSVWRHPIYLFAIITVTGLALILRSYGFIFIVLPVFIISVRIYIWNEEKKLIKRFGSTYEQYKRRVGLFVPGLQKWLRVLVFPFFKIWFGIRVYNKNNIPVSPPFFIVASHRNYLDPFFLSFALPWPIKHVSTFEMFRSKIHRKIFTVLGALAKKRYTSDTKNIILIKRALDQGYPVGIFPEGERSWTGKMQSLKPETLKLFKKFNHIPILPVRIEGNYLSWPRWTPRMLRSQVNISFEQVIEVNEDMETEKLEQLLIERIQPRNSIEQPIFCKSKNIIGNLSRVLYRCPACRNMDTLHEIPPRKIQCGTCGQIIEIDRRFNLKYTVNEEIIFISIPDLYNEIKVNPADLTQLKKPGLPETEHLLPAGHTVLYYSECSFYSEQNDAFVLIGKGIICLTDTGIDFLKDNEIISIPFNKLGAATIESYYKLQLYQPVEKFLYQVILEKESVLKWQDTIVLIMENSGLKKPVTR